LGTAFKLPSISEGRKNNRHLFFYLISYFNLCILCTYLSTISLGKNQQDQPVAVVPKQNKSSDQLKDSTDTFYDFFESGKENTQKEGKYINISGFE